MEISSGRVGFVLRKTRAVAGEGAATRGASPGQWARRPIRRPAPRLLLDLPQIGLQLRLGHSLVDALRSA